MKNLFSLSIIFLTIFLLLFLETILDSLSLELFVGYKQIILTTSCLFILLFNFKNFIIPNKLRNLLFFLSLFIFLSFLFNPIPVTKFLFGFTSSLLFICVFIIYNNIYFKLSSIFILLLFLILLILISTIYTFSSILYSTNLREQLTLFRELGFYGCVTSFGVIISLSLNLKFNNKIFLLLAIFLTLSVFATVLKKSILDVLLIWIFFIFFKYKKIYGTIIITSIICVLIFTFPLYSKPLIENFKENIDYYNSTKEDGVRIVMYFTAFTLATNYFPLGTGLGTFGSPASVFGGDYSNIYYNTGIANIPEMSPENVMNGKPHTLFDTFWPHIIGELGYIGLIFFLFIWFYPLKLMFDYRKIFHYEKYKFIYFYILTTFVLITLDGFTLFLPEQPAIIIFYSLIPAILLKHIKLNEKA